MLIISINTKKFVNSLDENHSILRMEAIPDFPLRWYEWQKYWTKLHGVKLTWKGCNYPLYRGTQATQWWLGAKSSLYMQVL